MLLAVETRKRLLTLSKTFLCRTQTEHDPPAVVCSGKTSLLFHFAYHLASKGQEVWMLCDQNSLDQNPPFLPVGVDQNNEMLTRIKFK